MLACAVFSMLALGAMAVCATLFAPLAVALFRCSFGIARGQNVTLRPLRVAVVVVGGDFARSPRMQYHAVSLARCGLFAAVELVGLRAGNKLCEDLQQLRRERRVGTKGLVKAPAVPRWAVFRRVWLLVTAYRVLSFVVSFSLALWCALIPTCGAIVLDEGPAVSSEAAGAGGERTLSPKRMLVVPFYIPTLVLVQTPPAVPFVPLVKLVLAGLRLAGVALAWTVLPLLTWFSVTAAALSDLLAHPYRIPGAVRSTRRYRPALVVDWHNFGFSLLQVDRRPPIAVALYKWCERRLCAGDFQLTVSRAMRAALARDKGRVPGLEALQLPLLRESFGINFDSIGVLRDTAPAFFAPCSRERLVREVLAGEALEVPEWFAASATADASPLASSPQTSAVDGFMFVSATSWTADDDYSLVVSAMRRLDELLAGTSKRVWLLVTGKGESRARFEQQVREACFSPRVRVTTAYLQSYNNYAKVIGAADCGLCVHRSASGLDLPMKVVDMFGCGLPVLALAYPALPELVTDSLGWTFDDAETLLGHLRDIVLSPNGSGRTVLQTKRDAVCALRAASSWDEEWARVALPPIADLVGASGRTAGC